MRLEQHLQIMDVILDEEEVRQGLLRQKLPDQEVDALNFLRGDSINIVGIRGLGH